VAYTRAKEATAACCLSCALTVRRSATSSSMWWLQPFSRAARVTASAMLRGWRRYVTTSEHGMSTSSGPHSASARYPPPLCRPRL
jgi:hypothetical protein